MSNDYYNNSVSLSAFTLAKAEDIDGDLNGIAAGFDKLPAPHASAPTTKGFSEVFKVVDATNEDNPPPVSQLRDAIFVGTDSGTANTYAVTLTPTPGSYTTGMLIIFKPIYSNTGACTVNVNTMGAKTIKSTDGGTPGANEIYAGNYVMLIYDGTYFQILTASMTALAVASVTIPAASGVLKTLQTNSAGSGYELGYSRLIPPSGVELTGGIVGMVLSNSTDTDHDISISAGACFDSAGVYHMSAAAAIVKQIDAAWAAGTAAGGLLTGTVGASELYNVYALRKDSDGTVDYGFLDKDLAIATYLPTGYSAYRWISFVVTDASANIRNFKMCGDDIVFNSAMQLQVNTTASAWTEFSLSSFAPAGRVFSVGLMACGGIAGGTIKYGPATGEAEVTSTTDGVSAWGDNAVRVHVNSSGSYWYYSSSAALDMWLKSVEIVR